MNLEDVTVALRPRGQWEAMDLGARMVRRDAKAIYLTWFALTLPAFALALTAVWFTPYAGMAVFLYWWIEPITDGPILHVISRRLFGERPTARDALRSTWPALRRNWIYLLTPYRLHLARSAMLSITRLEGLKGKRRRDRAKVIGRRIARPGGGLTVAYHHLALAVYFGVILLVFVLLPESLQASMGDGMWQLLWTPDSREANLISLILVYIAQTTMHPWWVGGGFGLYINCRTSLEAWDLEVAFRRMVARRRRGVAAAAVLLCAVGLSLSPASEAQEVASDEAAVEPVPVTGYWKESEVAPPLRRVQESDQFVSRETTYEYEYRWPRDADAEEAEEEPTAEARDGSWLDGLFSVIAIIIEFWLWIIVALVVVILFLTRKHWLGAISPSSPREGQRASVRVAGELIEAADFPEDYAAVALKLWRDGRARDALSLLFRGRLLDAAQRFDLALPDSATEGMCVTAVAKHADAAFTQHFASLTQAWVACAYAGRLPEAAQFQRLAESAAVTGGEVA
ncbi:MAG: hypothetical protein AAGF61_01840 [Pseudomonadota bacterium]